jgi:membrane protease YdiL (CAAX protease family)
MVGDLPPPTRGWRVVRLLWSASRRRAAGRARRQQEIMGHRRNKGGDRLSSLSRILTVLVVCFVHATLGWFVLRFAQMSGDADVNRGGQLIAISSRHWHLLENLAARQNELLARRKALADLPSPRFEDRQPVIRAERARDDALMRLVRATKLSGKPDAAAQHHLIVERQFQQQGAAGFARVDDSLAAQLGSSSNRLTAIVPLLSLVLLCWLGMLVCQGEGLELDVQRRRHPMWEWLLSHPVRPAHAFYAELLAPLMANPVYFSAPIFLWVVLGHLYGIGAGLLAALLIGLPVAIVASAFNKAIEMTALLRLGVRSRGALLGILSWFGYVAMLLPLLTLQAEGIGRPLARFAFWISPWIPTWPVRALTIGWGETRSLPEVVISWWIVATALGAFALWTTHGATSQGLQAPTQGGGPAGVSSLSTRRRLGANPLQRKELLWLIRDKGAVVQIILIPLTIAASQLFYFSGLYRMTSMSWTVMCGLAIICGTYFLLVLGPRSLASEGGALWLALTWPRGLEELLRAKALLWNRLANVVVGAMLIAAAVVYPTAWWKIFLVYCGWLLFSRTLSLKAVALVTAPSASGEPDPPNRARQWIAMIGTLAFGTGIVTASWHVAIIGIVFSSLVSVAMWQALRARLSYLFDPWSEESIPAPSLLHVAVGIALLVEIVGVSTAIASVAGGPSALWLARALSYGLVGAVGCLVMQGFLNRRGVGLADVIRWGGLVPRFRLVTGLVLGAGAGLAVAALATGYIALLQFVPQLRESIDEAVKVAATYEGEKFWIFLLAVGFAPIAEEYFFRGLLFRALDRELGYWRSLVLSAAFFAIFHPPLAWMPVACLGICAAWIFRTTRHLLPCIVCHVVYNACILGLAQLDK